MDQEKRQIVDHEPKVVPSVLEQKDGGLLTPANLLELRKYESPGPQVDKDGHIIYYRGNLVAFNQRGN